MLKLSELRQNKGITQQEPADKIGVRNYTIANWEQGRAEPSIVDLKTLSDYFNCSIDYLVGREDEFGTINADKQMLKPEQELMLKLRQLPKQKQQMISDLINDLYLLYKKR